MHIYLLTFAQLSKNFILLKPMPQSTSDIKQFWNEQPVGSNFVAYQQDKSFYDKYDDFRYRTEAHILDELNASGFKNRKVVEIGLGQGAD